MPYGWTAEQLRNAIARCEVDIEQRVQRHEHPERIESARKQVNQLRKWLKEAEQAEAKTHGKNKSA